MGIVNIRWDFNAMKQFIRNVKDKNFFFALCLKTTHAQYSFLHSVPRKSLENNEKNKDSERKLAESRHFFFFLFSFFFFLLTNDATRLPNARRQAFTLPLSLPLSFTVIIIQRRISPIVRLADFLRICV